MTTLAVLSDLHANLPALEAALDRLDGEAADGVYHLGDLVGYAPWPNEVVERIRARAIPGVAGNYDTTVATGYDHCGCRYDDPRQQELSRASYGWTLEHTRADVARWLGTLPFRLDLQPEGGHMPGRRVTLVHGTPTLNTLYWGVAVEHVRLEYDVERAARAIRRCGLPEELATILETGGRLPADDSTPPPAR